MPILDMSVKEMENYLGTNPRPKDFDEYWSKALVEMQTIDAQVVMKKADFAAPTVECYDVWFIGNNGAKIYAKHLRPKNIVGKIPAVLRFHGYSADSGDWVSHLHYAASGVAVFALDVRGQGGKSQDIGGVNGSTWHGHIVRGLLEENPQKLFFRDIFLDTVRLAQIAMDMDYIDETKVYTCGGSQGGALAIACAALEPRIAKVASVYPFLCDYKRVWDMDLDEQAYVELKEYFRKFDPRHEKEYEIFEKLGYIDLQNLAERIEGKVLMFTGLMDEACPPSTQYAVYNKLRCEKKHILYPDYGHEWLKDAEDIMFQFLVMDN